MAQSSRQFTGAIVFDGDDTLWSTEPLYDRARSRARREVARAGLDGARWEMLERDIDVTNIARFGFSTKRFPTSCVEAYRRLCAEKGKAVNPAVAVRVRKAAQTVFTANPRLVPGAQATLRRLRECGFKLALITKGDRRLQQVRVQRSGIANAFDQIRIVPDKKPQVFEQVIKSLRVSPTNAWTVGNSIRSDIVPALEAGLRAIWIDAHVWEHERSHQNLDPRVIRASTLSEVPGLVKALAESNTQTATT